MTLRYIEKRGYFALICLSACFGRSDDGRAEPDLGGVESCGRLVVPGTVLGRPCPVSGQDTGCDVTADVCLTDAADDMPGFCSVSCDPAAQDPCPGGERCALVTGIGEAYCLPEACLCLAIPDLDVGEQDVVQSALDALELTRCDIAYTLAQRQAAGAAVANDPFRLAVAGQVRNEALSGARMVVRQFDTLAADSSLGNVIRLAAAELGRTSELAPPDFASMTFCQAVVSLYAGSQEMPPTCGELGPVGGSMNARAAGATTLPKPARNRVCRPW